jgi:hypothetical protein
MQRNRKQILQTLLHPAIAKRRRMPHRARVRRVRAPGLQHHQALHAGQKPTWKRYGYAYYFVILWFRLKAGLDQKSRVFSPRTPPGASFKACVVTRLLPYSGLF